MLLFSQYLKGPRIHPCLQIIAESLLPPLSVKSWSGLFFSPGSRSSLPVTYSLGLSQALCTGVLKAVINRYLNNGSKVYACLIDASKAFDLVDHRILFDKLLERGTPKPVVHLV